MEEGAGVEVAELGEAMYGGGVVVVDGELAPPLRRMASFFDVGSTAVTGGGAVMKVVVVGILVVLEGRVIIPQGRFATILELIISLRRRLFACLIVLCLICGSR